jgi:hypothetical protein
MLVALDALPVSHLVANELETAGEVCALGAVGRARHIDMVKIDPEDRETVATTFGIAAAMAAEIMYENDEAIGSRETPERRFDRMRHWIASEIKSETT